MVYQLVHRSGRDRVLGQDIQRVGRNRQRFDLAGQHAFGHHGRIDHIGPVQREEPPDGHFTDLVAGTPNTLQSGGNRGG